MTATECCVEGCPRAVLVRAARLCSMHYQRMRAHGHPGPAEPKKQRAVPGATCAVPKCPSTTLKARGWCNVHYARWLQTGDPGPAELLYQGTPPPRGLRMIVRREPACAGLPRLFDAELEGETHKERLVRHWEAAQVCSVCPALEACRLALPDVVATAPRRGAGVWAGFVVTNTGTTRPTDPTKQRCSRCGKTKPIKDFTSSSQLRRGAYCQPCAAEAARIRRQRLGQQQVA